MDGCRLWKEIIIHDMNCFINILGGVRVHLLWGGNHKATFIWIFPNSRSSGENAINIRSSMFNIKSQPKTLLSYLSGQVSLPSGWLSLKYPKKDCKVLTAIKYKNAEKMAKSIQREVKCKRF